MLIDRKHNRHTSFGLGLHRCIGSNVARAVFKVMLGAVLERMPDYQCDPAGAVHYDTVGLINGMKHLPATFTPGERLGPNLDDTIAHWQRVIDDERMAEPVTPSVRALDRHGRPGSVLDVRCAEVARGNAGTAWASSSCVQGPFVASLNTRRTTSGWPYTPT